MQKASDPSAIPTSLYAGLPFHYGWLICISCMLLAGAGSGIFVSTLGVFVRPVCGQFGFARAAFMLYSTIYFLTNVVMMPVYGKWFGKYSYRRIAMLCSCILSACLFAYSFAGSLPFFYGIALVSGLAVNGISLMAVGVLVSRWFAASRGLASGIAFSGSGILASLLIPVCTRWIESMGIAAAYRILALVELGLTLPVLLLIVRDRPEDIGLLPFGAASAPLPEAKAAADQAGNAAKAAAQKDDFGYTRAQALHQPVFWLLFLAVLGIAVCQAGPNSNTVSILGDMGYSAAYAARISSAYMICLTIFKVLIGVIFDKIGSFAGSMLVGSACVLFPVTAIFFRYAAAPWIYVVLLAIAGSGSSVLGNILTGTYLGRKDFAGIYSLIALATQLGAAFSSPIFGFIYDATGAYFYAWLLIITLGLVVTACLFLCQRLHRSQLPQL